uniref:hypothetical protein n=1 Tax=Pseudomonas viridiflava TaxID=33069 RepID=UPI0013CE59E8
EGMPFGAVMGWGLWAGVRLYLLDKRSAEQSLELLATRKTVESLQQRLTLLEYPPVQVRSLPPTRSRPLRCPPTRSSSQRRPSDPS